MIFGNSKSQTSEPGLRGGVLIYCLIRNPWGDNRLFNSVSFFRDNFSSLGVSSFVLRNNLGNELVLELPFRLRI